MASSSKQLSNSIKLIRKKLIGLDRLKIKFLAKTKTKNVDKLKKLADDLNINIKEAHEAALKSIADDLYLSLGIAMESKVWGWDYGDGDIVDSGALRDSLSIEVQGSNINIRYEEEYAAIVYYGGYIHPYGNPYVQIYMPARPWIDAIFTGANGVPIFDFAGLYEKAFTNYLKANI